MFDVATYGAIGDGLNDDRPAIQLAIDAAQAAGGGIVFFPAGKYLLDSPHASVTGICLYIDGDNVFLEGLGRGISIIKLGDGVNAALTNFNLVTGGGVKKLELDGNRANNSGGHAIRSSDSLTDVVFQDLFIHDTGGYGVGLQYGTFTNVLLDNILVEDTSSDGIDIKNKNDNSTGNKMSNITVRRAGLNTALNTQACIDIRGEWHLVNIDCSEFVNDGITGRCSTGIRFRAGELGEESGLGSHYSTLVNFRIKPLSATDTIGVDFGAYDCQASNGSVHSCGIGYQFDNVENLAGQLFARECNDGFVFNEGADYNVVSASRSRDSTDSGFKVYADFTLLSDVDAQGNAVRGVNIRSSANHTAISGISTGNTTNLYNAGTNTHNFGLVT